MIEAIKNVFSKRTVDQLRNEALEQARRDLLVAESNLDYAKSQVAYNKAVIERLEKHGNQKSAA